MTSLVYPNRAALTWQRYRRLVSGFANWGALLARKVGLRRNGELVMRTRSGLRMTVPAPLTFTFKEIFLHATYDLPAIVSTLPERPVVLDIGANAGFFSLSIFHRRPGARCLAFEPNPVNFRLLGQNRQGNPSADWQVFNEAVAGADGELEFTMPDGDDFSTRSRLASTQPAGATPTTRLTKVRTASLATLFARHSLARSDWIKMDCEGAEYDALYSASPDLLQRVSALSIEAHQLDTAARNKEALGRFLEAAGFAVFLADDDVLHAIRNARP